MLYIEQTVSPATRGGPMRFDAFVPSRVEHVTVAIGRVVVGYKIPTKMQVGLYRKNFSTRIKHDDERTCHYYDITKYILKDSRTRT